MRTDRFQALFPGSQGDAAHWPSLLMIRLVQHRADPAADLIGM